MRLRRLLLSTFLSLSSAGTAVAATYAIDANHTQVSFTYSHFGYSNLSGRLTGVTGSFDFDPAKPENSAIDVQLPLASLSTGVPRLDTHLASADFFDVEKYPTASFKSSKVTAAGKDRLSVAGDLTLHGVTRPVLLDVTINQLGEHPMRKTKMAGFDAVATIKRSEFGIDRMLPGVPDEVRLNISMEAAQPKAPAAEAAPPAN